MKKFAFFLAFIMLFSCVPFARAFVSGEYIWRELEDGTIELRKYRGDAEKLVVPAKMEGMAVTSISYMIGGSDTIIEVIIPKGVTNLGECALAGCESLTKVKLPSSLVSIGYCAFYGSKSLVDISIPKSVSSIQTGAFQNCSSLTEVTIPKNVTQIGPDAFNGCTSLTEITIPKAVTYIGDGAFEGCDSVTLIVKKGSYAEDYAKENGIPYKN